MVLLVAFRSERRHSLFERSLADLARKKFARLRPHKFLVEPLLFF